MLLKNETLIFPSDAVYIPGNYTTDPVTMPHWFSNKTDYEASVKKVMELQKI